MVGGGSREAVELNQGGEAHLVVEREGGEAEPLGISRIELVVDGAPDPDGLGDRPFLVSLHPEPEAVPVLSQVVLVRARRVNGSVHIEVLDEGEGIPPADVERIFDKFYRVQAADRKRAGTGLGLAIGRGFIEAMGGTIVANNRSDHAGAVFDISLPAFLTETSPQEVVA